MESHFVQTHAPNNFGDDVATEDNYTYYCPSCYDSSRKPFDVLLHILDVHPYSDIDEVKLRRKLYLQSDFETLCFPGARLETVQNMLDRGRCVDILIQLRKVLFIQKADNAVRAVSANSESGVGSSSNLKLQLQKSLKTLPIVLEKLNSIKRGYDFVAILDDIATGRLSPVHRRLTSFLDLNSVKVQALHEQRKSLKRRTSTRVRNNDKCSTPAKVRKTGADSANNALGINYFEVNRTSEMNESVMHNKDEDLELNVLENPRQIDAGDTETSANDIQQTIPLLICEENSCGRLFTQRRNLTRHIRQSHGLMNIYKKQSQTRVNTNCERCGKRVHSMADHMRLTHPDLPYISHNLVTNSTSDHTPVDDHSDDDNDGVPVTDGMEARPERVEEQPNQSTTTLDQPICDFCGEQVASISDHMTISHPDVQSPAADQSPALLEGQCEICGKHLHKKSLRKHVLRSHPTHYELVKKPLRTSFMCSMPDCNMNFYRRTAMLKHITDIHGHETEIENLHFTTTSEFKNWKAFEEEENALCFTKQNGSKRPRDGQPELQYFICQRDGENRSNRRECLTNRRRNFSVKLGLTHRCPSQMCVKLYQDDSVDVKYYKTHSHTIEINEAAIRPVSKLLREDVVAKLQAGNAVDDILEEVNVQALQSGKRPTLRKKYVRGLQRKLNPNLPKLKGGRPRTKQVSMEKMATLVDGAETSNKTFMIEQALAQPGVEVTLVDDGTGLSNPPFLQQIIDLEPYLTSVNQPIQLETETGQSIQVHLQEDGKLVISASDGQQLNWLHQPHEP